jgi:hypothetical protein
MKTQLFKIIETAIRVLALAKPTVKVFPKRMYLKESCLLDPVGLTARLHRPAQKQSVTLVHFQESAFETNPISSKIQKIISHFIQKE